MTVNDGVFSFLKGESPTYSFPLFFKLTILETTLETFNLDLWTKKMSIEEMNMMIFQSFMTVANTYERATSEDQLANAMRDFAEFFGEKTKILPKSGKFEGDGEG